MEKKIEKKRLQKEKTCGFKEKDEKKKLGNPPFAAADAFSSSSWSPSPHMPPLSPVRCSFFKIMMKNFKEVLFIPPKFAQTIAMLENKNVYIGNSNGDTWSVEMSIVDGSLAFQQGWNSFVLDNFLKTGDVVTFKYIGGVLFFARIYGRSSCDNGYLSTKNNPDIREKTPKPAMSTSYFFEGKKSSDDLRDRSKQHLEKPRHLKSLRISKVAPAVEEYTKPKGKKQTKHKEEAETAVDFSGRLKKSGEETQRKHGEIVHDNLSRTFRGNPTELRKDPLDMTSNDLLNPKAFGKEFGSRQKDRLKKQVAKCGHLNSFRTPKVAAVECTKPESKNQIKVKEEVVSAEDFSGQLNKAGKDRLEKHEEIVDYSFSRRHNAYQKCSETGRENLVEPCNGTLNPRAFEDNLCGHQKDRLKKQLEKPKNLKRCRTSKLAPVVECASPESKKQMKSKKEEATTVDCSRKLNNNEEERVADQGEIVDDSLSVTHSADKECSKASKANLIETCKEPSNMASEEHLYPIKFEANDRTHQKCGLKKHDKKPEHIKRSRTSKVQPVVVERINPKRKKQVKSKGEKLTNEDFFRPINEAGEDSIRKQQETVDKSLSITRSAHGNSKCGMSKLPLVASGGWAPHILSKSREHHESPDTIEINSCHLAMAPYSFKEGKASTSEKNIVLAEDESMKLRDNLTGMVPCVSIGEKGCTTLDNRFILIKTESMELCNSLTGMVPYVPDMKEESTSLEKCSVPTLVQNNSRVSLIAPAQSSWLALPEKLLSRLGRTKIEKKMVILRDSSMRMWPVVYHESYKFIGFVGGWEEFSTANNLQQGDLCEFEDLGAPECMFHVHIFR